MNIIALIISAIAFAPQPTAFEIADAYLDEYGYFPLGSCCVYDIATGASACYEPISMSACRLTYDIPGNYVFFTATQGCEGCPDVGYCVDCFGNCSGPVHEGQCDDDGEWLYTGGQLDCPTSLPPLGACCYWYQPTDTTMTCVEVTQHCCTDKYQGLWQGSGSTCSPDPCNSNPPE